MAKERDVNGNNSVEEAYTELLMHEFPNGVVPEKEEGKTEENNNVFEEKKAEAENASGENTREALSEAAEKFADGGEPEDIKSHSEKNPFKRIAAWYKGLTKGKKIAATVGAAVIVLLIILIIFAAVFVLNKFNKIGTSIDTPKSYDDVIYDEDDFTEIDGQVGAAGFKEALYEWATAGDESSVMQSKNVLNVLLIGADSRTGSNSGNTDVMMVVSLNKKTKEIKLISIFRDCYLYIENGEYSTYHKLNAAYSRGGVDCLINTIQNNFKIKIDNYVMVNFESFKDVINAMGGVTVKVQEYEANYIENHFNIKMPVGDSVTLNGEQALIFSRVRGCDADADVSRTRRQRQVINAIIDEFQSASLTNLNKYIDTVLPYIYTGFSKGEIVSLAMKALAGGWVSYPRSELQMPPIEARASGYAGDMWIWIVDYQLAAHTMQTEIYGTSNITLEDGRRTIIDIYKGTAASGTSNSASGSKPLDSAETTVPVSGEETTVPVSGEETTVPVSGEEVSDIPENSENSGDGDNTSEPAGGENGEEVTTPEGEQNPDKTPPVTEPSDENEVKETGVQSE